MAFQLPNLPYEYDALEPHISPEALELHYDKHHRGYVETLNERTAGTPYKKMNLAEVVLAANTNNDAEIFNAAAQSWNHAFFWRCMTPPNGGNRPKGPLLQRIEKDFGSYDAFSEAFLDCATGQFGSGWAWLVLENGALKVTSTGNADLPQVHNQHAIITCDVWEHAYYLDYRNERGAYVRAFIENLIDWDFASERFALQGESGISAARDLREAQHAFAQSGRVDEAAQAAAEALDGPEGDELERARRSTAAQQD